jgi:hypothetical protein
MTNLLSDRTGTDGELSQGPSLSGKTSDEASSGGSNIPTLYIVSALHKSGSVVYSQSLRAGCSFSSFSESRALIFVDCRHAGD